MNGQPTLPVVSVNVCSLSDPLKIARTGIALVAVPVVDNRKIVWVGDKRFRNKPMD